MSAADRPTGIMDVLHNNVCCCMSRVNMIHLVGNKKKQQLPYNKSFFLKIYFSLITFVLVNKALIYRLLFSHKLGHEMYCSAP